MAKKKATKKNIVKKKSVKKQVKKKVVKKKSVKKPQKKTTEKREPYKKPDGRIDWFRNNELLKDIYIQHMADNKGQHPTLTQLCEESGLSRKTVVNHIKDFSFEKMKKGSKAKLLLPVVLERLAHRCAHGTATDRDIKLLFQITVDWSEKQTVENINRYDYRALKEKFDPADDLETQVKKLNEFLLGQN